MCASPAPGQAASPSPEDLGDLDEVFAALDALASVGAAIALHIRSSSPFVMQSSYPDDWRTEYRSSAYALRDPVIWWGLSHLGSSRWGDLGLPDPYGIMSKARDAGLTYGAVFSCGPLSSRSVVSIARDDREVSDEEIEVGLALTNRIHDLSAPKQTLTEAQRAALRSVADGKRVAQASFELGVSESALKARLIRVREALDVRTLPEAIHKANHFGMI